MLVFGAPRTTVVLAIQNLHKVNMHLPSARRVKYIQLSAFTTVHRVKYIEISAQRDSMHLSPISIASHSFAARFDQPCFAPFRAYAPCFASCAHLRARARGFARPRAASRFAWRRAGFAWASSTASRAASCASRELLRVASHVLRVRHWAGFAHLALASCPEAPGRLFTASI